MSLDHKMILVAGTTEWFGKTPTARILNDCGPAAIRSTAGARSSGPKCSETARTR
jgi:hypothetical protein